jgi:translation initiation factor IF-2
MRVHELAKKLGLETKALMQRIEEAGVKVKSHMAAVSKKEIDLILDAIQKAVKKKIGKTKGKKIVKKKISVPKPKKEIKPKAEEKKQPVEKEEIKKPIEEEKKILIPEKKEGVFIEEHYTVGEIAKALNVSASELITILIDKGIFASINQRLDKKIIYDLSQDFGFQIGAPDKEKKTQTPEIKKVNINKKDKNISLRAPVVVVIGHVDHGKTTLLDSIRKTNVVKTEAGGITQHIGASEIETKKGKIVFIDTPGHEAFTALRSRGVKVTDLAILIIAADDGVMPQTIEAINHAKVANTPIIVAINKTDLPSANVERVKQQLAKYDIIPEKWGGKNIFVEISALKKQGIDELLEMILLENEMLELKTVKEGPAEGVIIEAGLDKRRGSLASLLIQKGKLCVGDSIISNTCAGKIKAMYNSRGENIESSTAVSPVEILGFYNVPQAGENFKVVNKDAGEAYKNELKDAQKKKPLTLENVYSELADETNHLKLVLKADKQGSLEAIVDTLKDVSYENLSIKIIHNGVGNINESDVMLASVSGAIVIGFNVKIEGRAKEIADKQLVEILSYNIIYKLIDDIKSALAGLLKPEIKERVIGKAEVREVFDISKIGQIAGTYVLNGKISRGSKVRLKRGDEEIYKGNLITLKRFKEDVKEVQANFECGIRLENYKDIEVGDIIETFETYKEFRKIKK